MVYISHNYVSFTYFFKYTFRYITIYWFITHVDIK